MYPRRLLPTATIISITTTDARKLWVVRDMDGEIEVELSFLWLDGIDRSDICFEKSILGLIKQ